MLAQTASRDRLLLVTGDPDLARGRDPAVYRSHCDSHGVVLARPPSLLRRATGQRTHSQEVYLLSQGRQQGEFSETVEYYTTDDGLLHGTCRGVEQVLHVRIT